MRVVKGCLFYLCTDKKKSVGTCEHVITCSTEEEISFCLFNKKNKSWAHMKLL